jgi:hypothetical protein
MDEGRGAKCARRQAPWPTHVTTLAPLVEARLGATHMAGWLGTMYSTHVAAGFPSHPCLECRGSSRRVRVSIVGGTPAFTTVMRCDARTVNLQVPL